MISYRPEIDGLRACAVVPVILFHLGVGGLEGGFVGVDVFYVISGFLITSVVLKQVENGSFTFRSFWTRRVLRIFPALLVVTLAVLAVTYMFTFRPGQAEVGRQGVAALLSVSNLYFWRAAGDYWGPTAENAPLLHTWSLAVEEQFYVLLPLSVWALVRFREGWLARAFSITALLSFAAFIWGAEARPAATFYLLPARAWELLAGCLLAIKLPSGATPRYVSGALADLLGLLGIVILGACYWAVDGLGWGVLTAVAGASLVITFGAGGVTYKLLASRPLVHIGKVSYSLYLWHWPVIVLAERLEVHTGLHVILALIYGLALCSYLFVEGPIRKSRRCLKPVLAVGALTLSLGMLLSIPRHYDVSGFSAPTWRHYEFNLDPVEEPGALADGVAWGVSMSARGHPVDAFRNEGVIVGPATAPVEVLLFGDSHGLMWSGVLEHVVEQAGVGARFFSMGGVTPFMSVPAELPMDGIRNLSRKDKLDYDRARIRAISQWGAPAVFISAYWAERDFASADDLLAYLGDYTTRVFLIEDPPCLDIGSNDNAMEAAVFRGLLPSDGKRQYFPIRTDEGRDVVRALAEKHDHVDVLEVWDLFADGATTLLLDGAQVMYVDDDHLTERGAWLALPRFVRALENLLGPESDRGR